VDDYEYGREDRLLFDANIWLFLYGPQYGPMDGRVKAYSAALKDILTARAQIFIDVLVLSEFINSYARYRFNTVPRATRDRDFKKFRNGPGFVKVAQEIAAGCRRILAQSTPIESGFGGVDLAALLQDYETERRDFNDQILERLCGRQDLALVTHDSDFGDRNLTLLTANKAILNRRGETRRNEDE
jgi:predicted nucleic acid-binding protein